MTTDDAAAEIARLQAELAALQELYADRDQDLSYEYTARLAAEALADALTDLSAYADHRDHCGEACDCGLYHVEDRVRAARAALAEANAQALAAARVMALGRAALAYEALRGLGQRGWTTETAGQVAAARAAYYAALRTAQGVPQ